MIIKLIKTASLLSVAFICISGRAQLIDHTSSFRNLPAKSYFRFHYDNDFFTGTDHYYSQGITFEYAHPSLRKFFLYKLLLCPANTNSTSGISFNLFGGTPLSTASDSVLYGDRPYSSAMSVKFFGTATDTVHHQQFASSVQAGVIGPLAQGENIQTGIHRLTNNPLPKGWQHQVQNDIILNYQFSYEKRIAAANGLLIHLAAEARVGTLQDRISTGLNFMTGHFSDPCKRSKRKKSACYFFGQGRMNLVGYDALLQGGLFNKKSPYVIAASDISRVTWQADAGVILNLGGIYLSYTQSFLSKEFRTGRYHRWGGVSIGFRLR